MKRRDFLKGAVGTAGLLVIPSIVLAKPSTEQLIPKTVDELYRAINSLGIDHPTHSLKAWETIRGLRYSHKTYSLGTFQVDDRAEERLVAPLWEDAKLVMIQTIKPLIVWRKVPQYLVARDYDTGELQARVYMRYSVQSSVDYTKLCTIKREGTESNILVDNFGITN